MKHSVCLVFTFLLVCYTHAETEFVIDMDSDNEFLYNPGEPILNATLDVYNGSLPDGWEIPPFQSKWLEYYDSSSEFVGGGGETDSCSIPFSELPGLPSLADVDGVWVTCESRENLPNFTFIMRQLEGFQTLNISYYLHGSVAIRVKVFGICFDYSVRDTDSDCEFIPVQKPTGWEQISYTAAGNLTSFLRFTIEMIAAEVNDFVLIEKIEASVYLPCEEENPVDCPRPTTPTTTSTSTPRPDTTIISTETSLSTTTSDNCTSSSTDVTTEGSTTEISSSESPTTLDGSSTKDKTTPISTTTLPTSTCKDEGGSSDSTSFATNVILLNLSMFLLISIC